jgi:hypothetical protein
VPGVTVEQGDIASLLHDLEVTQESLADLMRVASPDALAALRRDDAGWAAIGTGSDPIDRDKLLSVVATARVMAVADPLIKRALSLRGAYVWARGVTINAAQEDGAEQDVNAVVQAFLDDVSNRESFSSEQAHQDRERTLGTDGNVILALITDPVFGRVQVRKIPVGQVTDVICDPDDEATPWLYRREYRTRIVEPGAATGSTRMRTEVRRVYYPDIDYQPATRARSLGGIPIEWDKPVLHVAVNRLGTWGIPDAYAAIPWAIAFRDFLNDWAKIARAISTIAFQATAKTKTGAAQLRQRLASPAVDATGPIPAQPVGQTAIVGEGNRLEVVGKSGATLDSNSGLPLAAMVGSALGVPVTILTANPTTTGARAVADTLDAPLRLEMKMRQDLHAQLIRRVLAYVIGQAIKAPSGPLRGARVIDRVTGREVITLAGDQSRAIEVDFPDVSDVSLKDLTEALERADGMELLPPLVLARLLLLALEVDDVDAIMEQITDDQGNFVPPSRGDIPELPDAPADDDQGGE